MNKGLELLALTEQLEASKGWKIFNEIKMLATSYFIFAGNYQELKKAIDVFQNPKTSKNLWAVENRDKLDALLEEIIRLFHNFISSVMSLVDHTRSFAKKMYKNSEFFDEYSVRVGSQFKNSAFSNFVTDLRDYTLHKGLPMFSATLTLNTKLESSVMLNVKKLRSWEKWSKKAKEHIDTLGDEIRLDELIDSYRLLVIDFYNWFGKRQEEFHKKEIEEVTKLQNRIRLWLDRHNKKETKMMHAVIKNTKNNK